MFPMTMHNSLSGELGGGVGTSRLMTIGAELKGGLREAVGMEGGRKHEPWGGSQCSGHGWRSCEDLPENVDNMEEGLAISCDLWF